MEQSIYLSKYADEVLPCEPTLEGWATWLASTDREWPHPIPADGETFEAHVTEWLPDIVADRSPSGWRFSREPTGEDFLAIRYGEGLGWSPDNIVWGENMAEALREWFAENDDNCDDIEFIAAGKSKPRTILTYRSNPPRLIVEGAVQ